MSTSKPAEVSSAEGYGGDITDVYAASAVGIVVLAALGWYVFWTTPSGQHGTLVLVSALAGVAGWGAGIVATPYNRREAGRLSRIAQVIYAALTGYLIGKFDRVVDALITKPGTSSVDRSLVPAFAVGATVFLVAAIYTYITRSYFWSSQRT